MSYESPVRPKEVPEIYRLIANKASVAELSVQLYKDFSVFGDPEKAFLGIQEILSRGFEGRAALMQMATGSDELSHHIAEILKCDPIDDSDLERVLGIKRFGELITNLDLLLEQSFYYLRERGKAQDFGAFSVKCKKDKMRTGVPAQLDGSIEGHTLNRCSTFVVSEPNYLEALGASELLRLREAVGEKMLLLGSLGKYSAREFRQFAEKITSEPDTTVIDISLASIVKMLEDPSLNKVIQADARALPFEDGSMDQIYTNYLFHIANRGDTNHEAKGNISQIIKEAARVLKPGGYLVLCEREFQNANGVVDESVINSLLYRLNLIAQANGLRRVRSSIVSYDYVVREENGSAVIDENGFPHYEKSLISRSKRECVTVRFVKE